MLGATASAHACEHAAMRREHLSRAVGCAGVVVLLLVVSYVAKAWYDSRLPATYNVMSLGHTEYGGGPVPPGHAGHDGHGQISGGVSVADLRGPGGVPDDRFRLTARAATIRLSSGRTVDALTFDSRSPGPELRVRQGDLVEVDLRNEDVAGGVTIHWHGVHVPNGEDGVAGVTQDAVLPGQHYAYRFRANQAGTFWYHSHQVSSKEVRRGLFGAFVIEPRDKPHRLADWALAIHTFDGIPTINGDDGIAQRAVAPGTPVRLRLLDTDSVAQRLALDGTPFRVVAIDGRDLHGPTEVEDRALELAAGGRIDVSFTMPRSPVRLSLGETKAALVLSGDGKTIPPIQRPHEEEFDPLTYGSPAPTPFGLSTRYDRRFHLTITRKLGFFDGRPGRQWAINGGIYPDVPMYEVAKGDLVEMTIANHTKNVHPMHLHGHHVLVLSRDGEPSTGSPWWVDTLNVHAGETFVVAFRADNPGIWMDHCHNLPHAAAGLTMHLAYIGVTTPFEIGDHTHNTPE
jgi:FtsP/CotA-like multicopper oxidase with cupredoxin domain